MVWRGAAWRGAAWRGAAWRGAGFDSHVPEGVPVVTVGRKPAGAAAVPVLGLGPKGSHQRVEGRVDQLGQIMIPSDLKAVKRQ